MKKITRAFIVFALLFLASCNAQGQFSLTSGVQMSPGVLVVLQVVIVVLMLAGLFSLFLLIIPGLTVIWLAAFIYGLLTGFDLTSTIIFFVITLLMAFGNIVDNFLMGAKARKRGASWWGIIASFIAAFIGSLLFPPFGGIIASMAVLFVFEYFRLRDLRKAGESAGQMVIGCATAALVRFGIGLVMIALWFVWVVQSGKGLF